MFANYNQFIKYISCIVLYCLPLLLSVYVAEAKAVGVSVEFPHTLPLSTRGRHIVDNNNYIWRPLGVNWAGASTLAKVPDGLEVKTINEVAQIIKNMGFSAVRLPFANQMLHDSSAVSFSSVSANPSLAGKTPWQVYKAVTKGLTDAGLIVMINNHTSGYSWCCTQNDKEGVWRSWVSGGYEQTAEQWIQDWETLAREFKKSEYAGRVAMFDLRNEVRTFYCCGASNWGFWDPHWDSWGLNNGRDDRTNYKLAATEAGNRIHEIFPGALIVVEGINFTLEQQYGVNRPLLRPVHNSDGSGPIKLEKPNKLVYQVHQYAFLSWKFEIGLEDAWFSYASEVSYGDGACANSNEFNNGIPCTSLNQNHAYIKDLSNEEWAKVLDNGNNYTAPVIFGEFGLSNNASLAAKRWFSALMGVINDKKVGYFYWTLNAKKWHSAEGEEETFGLVDSTWTPKNDFRTNALGKYVFFADGLGNTEDFLTLNLKKSDQRNQVYRTISDWAPGQHKGECPQGHALSGISYGLHPRGLCQNISETGHNSPIEFFRIVSEERNIYTKSGYGNDWAHGLLKLQCPIGSAMVGYSTDSTIGGLSNIICEYFTPYIFYPTELISTTVVNFRWGDHRRSQVGGDWHYGERKGQCSADEVIIGIAGSGYGRPERALCAKW